MYQNYVTGCHHSLQWRFWQFEQLKVTVSKVFKVSNGNTRAICEICSKLIEIEVTRLICRSGFFIVTFEQILYIVLVFPLLTLNR